MFQGEPVTEDLNLTGNQMTKHKSWPSTCWLRVQHKPGTKFSSPLPMIQWGGNGGSGLSGKWQSRNANIGQCLSQNNLASLAASPTIFSICLFGAAGACNWQAQTVRSLESNKTEQLCQTDKQHCNSNNIRPHPHGIWIKLGDFTQ
jgi:hypothetical protein